MKLTWLIALAAAAPACAPRSSGSGAAPAASSDLATYAGAVYACVHQGFGPHAARGAGTWTGRAVHLRVEVTQEGSIANAVITRPSGDPQLDDAVTSAALRCRGLPPPPPELSDPAAGGALEIVFEPPA